MNTTSGKPVSVSTENMTPALARSARTIFCTPTDRATLEMVEALVDPVGDRPVGEQRGLAAAHGIEQHRRPAHVEVGLVLAGEARGRQVLRRRGAPHRHGQQFLAVFLPQRRIGLEHLRLGLRRQACGVHDLPAGSARPGERSHIGLIEPVELRVQPRPGVAPRQRVPEGIGGHGKAVRHRYAERRELAHHLAQARVLATDQRHVAEREFREPSDVAPLGHLELLKGPLPTAILAIRVAAALR